MSHRTTDRAPRRPQGFTLVELLVVIAIIGVLVALLLPAVQAARESARRAECTNNLKQMGLAVQTHHDTYGYFPEGRNALGPMGVAWSYRLLPYMELQNIYDAYDDNYRVDAEENAVAMRTPIGVYTCPSRRPASADRNFDNDDAEPLVEGVAVAGDYAANAGFEEDTNMEDSEFFEGKLDHTQVGPIFSGSRIKGRQVTDGLSKTLAIGERHIPPLDADDGRLGHFKQGDTCFLAADNIMAILRGTEDGLAVTPWDDDNDMFGSLHPGVAQFVFLDGHTQTLSTNNSARAIGLNPNGAEDIGDGGVFPEEWSWLGAMSTIAGGEVVQD
ncbi:Fimbrial protein precursor [Pseudobythopirellula maris]|uniref:Fimbrial protein n=1 Tax=Pseudobythopirellula maris TaxID=2527991 RepID=A0A5C5ZFP3_9BACT|nr:DUF1559 domain-containing protein [Pseudobythopirellula maris]TWT86142.1 Fimbrial protein precursor [Pseudobythopirellula maris]